MARVVKFREFLSLPNGTVYSHTVKGGVIPQGLSVKVETWQGYKGEDIDFIYYNLLAVGKDVGPEHVPVVNGDTSRWGGFDEADEFIVYDRTDLTYMATELTVALGRLLH